MFRCRMRHACTTVQLQSLSTASSGVLVHLVCAYFVIQVPPIAANAPVFADGDCYGWHIDADPVREAATTPGAPVFSVESVFLSAVSCAPTHSMPGRVCLTIDARRSQ
uniref:Uncharacterized protein n=1 Tax=Chrysotila carterae TaxID=13221 RepID=A0A6S9Z0B4_CHRCT